MKDAVEEGWVTIPDQLLHAERVGKSSHESQGKRQTSQIAEDHYKSFSIMHPRKSLSYFLIQLHLDKPIYSL